MSGSACIFSTDSGDYKTIFDLSSDISSNIRKMKYDINMKNGATILTGSLTYFEYTDETLVKLAKKTINSFNNNQKVKDFISKEFKTKVGTINEVKSLKKDGVLGIGYITDKGNFFVNTDVFDSWRKIIPHLNDELRVEKIKLGAEKIK